MHTTTKMLIAAALVSASHSAIAWWGWADDLFGDAGVGFSINFGTQSQARGRYYDYYAPNWTYPDGTGFPTPPSAEWRQTPSQEPPAALRQAVEAQRKLAEQLAANPHTIPRQTATPGRDPTRSIAPVGAQPTDPLSIEHAVLIERGHQDPAVQPAPAAVPAEIGGAEDGRVAGF